MQLTFKTLALAALITGAPTGALTAMTVKSNANPSALASTASVGAVIRPTVQCAKSPACRKEVADSLRTAARKLRDRAYDVADKLMELGGAISEAFTRNRDLGEVRERLDRIERELAAQGRLTQEIRHELEAVRTKLQ